MKILNRVNTFHKIDTPIASPSSSGPSPNIRSATPSSLLYSSHSWIPHNIEVTLTEKRELFVKKTDNLSKTSKKANPEVSMENGETANNLEMDLKTPENTENEGVENHVISNAESKEDIVKENKAQTIQYALSAVICYIEDKNNDDRRNLVGLIRVGEGYHERSSGKDMFQWYIFNDFWYKY